MIPSQRPEDDPAIRAVMQNETDLLSARLGLADQPPRQPASTPAAPAMPDTPGMPNAMAGGPNPPPQPPPDGANLNARPLHDRIATVLSKYSGDPAAIAQALVHSEAARSRAQMGLAEVSPAMQAIDARLGRVADVLERLPQYLTAAVQGQGNGQANGHANGGGANPNPGTAPLTNEQFYADPAAVIARVVDDRMKVHMQTFGEAQARHTAAQREADEWRQFQAANAAKINHLAPVMDLVFRANPGLYHALPRATATQLLMERAEERIEAYRGRTFFEEMNREFGNGAATAPPGTNGGGIPPAGAPRAVPGAMSGTPQGNWSETRSMNDLFRAGSGSVEEDRAIHGVLRERGFWDNPPPF